MSTPMKSLAKSLLAGVAAATLAVSPSAAQQGGEAPVPESYTGPASAIAAIVDDKVITTFDVQQRMRLMLMSAGREIPPEMMPQLEARALADLVEEQLKFVEAAEFEVTADASEITEELNLIASSSGLTVEQLQEVLAQNGVSIDTLIQQINANIIWPRLVRGRYGTRVRISDEDVEAALQRMRDEATNEQYLVSEICIPVTDPSQAQEIYQGSLQLIEQMRLGVPFAVVAQQFSACSSAAGGGDLGWVRAGELEPEVDQVIRELPPQSVTNPIPSDGAFMIYAVRDKREAVVAGEETFKLAYAGADLSMGRNAAILALEELAVADPCGGRALRQDLGAGVGVAVIEDVQIAEVDERFRSAIEDLDAGEMSGPVEADGYLHAAYVCEKDEGLGLPSRDALSDRLYGRQLERIAQQYLRDVERSSMVDIRIRPTEQQPNG